MGSRLSNLVYGLSFRDARRLATTAAPWAGGLSAPSVWGWPPRSYAKEAQAVASTGPDGLPASDAPAAITGNGSADAPEEALVAM